MKKLLEYILRERILVIIIAVAFLLRIINLNQSFWLDEAAQAIESSRPFGEQLNIVADFHPPLYHVFLHFWMIFGHSEIWIRLPSVFFGLGSIIVLYRIAVLLGDRKEGLLSVILLTLSPYHIWYAQEARPYMLFVFLSLLSSLFILQKNWIRYTVSIVLSAYTNYFTPFVFLGHAVYMYCFDKKNSNKFIKSILVTGILFIPWLPFFLQQLTVGTNGFFSGWSNIVSFPWARSVPLTFAKFIFGRGTFENKVVYASLILPIVMLFGFSIVRLLNKKEGKITLILFAIPFIFAVILSFFLPIVAPQRLIFLMPLFYLILAKGVTTVSKIWKSAMVVLVVLVSLSGIIQYYTNPYVQREQWRESVSYIESDKKDKSIVLFVFPGPFAPYLWYQKGLIETKGIAPNFLVTDENLQTMSFHLSEKTRVYLFQYLTGLTDPQEKTRRFIKTLGFKETSIKDFPGVGLIYVFNKT